MTQVLSSRMQAFYQSSSCDQHLLKAVCWYFDELNFLLVTCKYTCERKLAMKVSLKPIDREKRGHDTHYVVCTVCAQTAQKHNECQR